MKQNLNKISVLFALMATMCCGKAIAQNRTISPCPEVLIDQKYDHVPQRYYRQMGWDTAATCAEPTITLSAEPYIPVQYFNGYYTVESIPYNPPDTTFYLNYNPSTDANNPYKKKLQISNDDDYAPSPTNIAYPFYFFGIRKNQFRIGDNGIVTFTTSAMSDIHSGGPFCPYQVNSPIPWAPGGGTPGGDSYFDRTHDAIYGVYEDTYTGSGGSHMSGNQGIYYGVLDDYPCRKIICSWNQIPVFSDASKRQSYQIVCYEGSNIIEVHVKQRCAKPSTSKGIIGIQNATGVPQVKSSNRDDPNYYVQNGAPACFAAPGWNLQEATTGIINNVAFRFTPKGRTNKNEKWYRIFAGGRDSVDLPRYDPVTNPNAVNDTNGYYIAMNNDTNTAHPTLTQAVVSPTCVSRYVMELRFMNANGDWYFLRDTITIGIDTVNDMTLTLQGATSAATDTVRDICYGTSQTVSVSIPDRQEKKSTTWSVFRVLGGEERPLSASVYGVDGSNTNLTVVPDQRADTLPTNKIDSIYVQCAVEFASGCRNYKRVLIRIFPNFDTTIVDGICRGETYRWNPSGNNVHSFTTDTDPQTVFETLHSRPGCDSIVRLKLTVFDISHTTDHVEDCKPYRWINGKLYSQNNQQNYDIDTIILQNRYNCDSIVHLDFVIHPLTAKISSNLDHFDLDHLDVELTDISIGGDSRTWKFPTANDQTGATAYFTMPVNESEATIMLIAHSPYGCLDSTTITLPLTIETFWVPNAFTPDNPSGNNTFSSISSETLNEEMYIYNRFGQLVFYCNGVDCEWDGKDNNGIACPQGSYVYVIRYTNSFEPNLTRIKKGAVTLIR